MRILLTTAVAIAFTLSAAAPVAAAPCKDAKGKFIKCPPTPVKGQRCKNAKGVFAKCGTPGAVPIK